MWKIRLRKRITIYGIAFALAAGLPYIVTICLHPEDVLTASNTKTQYVTVKRSENEIYKIPLRTYGVGVLAKEMDVSCKPEALKAQAILIRTSIYRQLQDKGKGAVLTQEYLTIQQMEESWGEISGNTNYQKLQDAWDKTEGMVVLYEDKLALTPFHKVSNGSTRDGNEVFGSKDFSYLKMVDCPLDVESPEQLKTISLDDVKAEAIKYDSAGYVLSVQMEKEKCTGEAFRALYHLASGCYTIQEYEGKIRITTRGVGHGLGMSQYTAEKMAENGKKYQEIISYFFQNVQIKEVAQIVGVTE